MGQPDIHPEAFLSEKSQRSKLDTRLTPSICSWFWMEFKLSASPIPIKLMYADVCSQKNMFVKTQRSEKEGILSTAFYILPSIVEKSSSKKACKSKQKSNKSERLLMRKRFISEFSTRFCQNFSSASGWGFPSLKTCSGSCQETMQLWKGKMSGKKRVTGHWYVVSCRLKVVQNFMQWSYESACLST